MPASPHVIRIHQTGGPEVLTWEEVPVPDPGPGEILVRQGACGLNFIDIYFRTGLYPAPLPAVIGSEGAGTIEAVGPDVTQLKPGDRVGYAMGLGGYAERRVLPARQVVRLPDAISDEQAAAMMLQGLTAQYLLRRTFRVEPGQPILVHAAAGGVGLILCQWAKHLGATVIGTVGSREKAELSRINGCDHPILYREEDFTARVRELTGGRGVPVVYDAIGRDTFEGSIACLMPRGMMVSYGQASGPIPPIDIGKVLGGPRSLFLTRPGLAAYIADRAELDQAADELFQVVQSGIVRVDIRQRFALKDAAEAHRALEGRQTTGSTVLIP